jgi:hypothetical protein
MFGTHFCDDSAAFLPTAPPVRPQTASCNTAAPCLARHAVDATGAQ